MSELLEAPNIGPGLVIGLGGTHARTAHSDKGDITSFESVETPSQPKELFDWMASHTLEGAHDGKQWVVIGVPGPVSADGVYVGPMANVEGLKAQKYNLRQELIASDSAMIDFFESGGDVIVVNDGELVTQAAATLDEDNEYDRIAAVIVGTGVGAGIVDRDKAYTNVVRANRNDPFEIGHVQIGRSPLDTFENALSGPALERRYGVEAKDLPLGHPAWDEVGEGIGRMINTLGVMSRVELVVPCGGVGANAQSKYLNALGTQIDFLSEHANGVQKKFDPRIAFLNDNKADTFEMYGGESVMRDFVTRDK